MHARSHVLTIDPANQRARLYLAAIEGDRGRDRAEGLYVEAANGFQKTGEPTGEVYARLALTCCSRAAASNPPRRSSNRPNAPPLDRGT